MGDYTNVIQLELENDNSWYQLSPDPTPFIKLVLFKRTELGHIGQIPTFDNWRAGMYYPEQMKTSWNNIIHVSASDIVVKKLIKNILTNDNTIRVSDPKNLNLDDRLSMSHLLTPSFLPFSSTSGKKFVELGYIIQCLDKLFACFL